ncbi:alpha-D-ribose 1-methylphosphonate 5-triphosphate diphosphatase [Rhodobium orientis]|uniref:Phosphonate metabolism protein PhnM n=1 Tax=Rhodobium orientis TaxID=34017 RepID=A0A327JMG8_9HYPH|nr:alpha-D-ribose 1-methylphosphonate 5-triphosphate diphosphatase [Rhodobium orientis]MBB4303605.1 alpha-D-ribose 1-methylphosphonate 5-triphosphate diphosphatase [Rhodobium orientis]MBK5951939.1 phosphonate metabolism protein PhnM [Rhodobium orientis]RAI26786.1 phosphonate metabolism protein PhnM [Rhodobium orientis]
MLEADLVLKNARIVLPDAVVDGALVVQGGEIAAVETTTNAPGEDLSGDYLIPGLVELHTDHLEGHYAPRPGVRWDPVAAVQAHDAQIAGCGITTVFDAVRAGADADSKDLGHETRTLTDAIASAGREDRLRADHFIHLRCEISAVDVVDAARPFITEGVANLVSIMDHTPGQRQFVHLDKFREYYLGKSGMTEAELEEFIAERRRQHAACAAPNRAAIVRLCHESNIVIASHDDATPAHVDEAIADDVAIAEFPTTVEAAKASHGAGLRVLMGAPNLVRGGSHSGNVSAAELAGLGVLDILSSDYVPFSLLFAAFMLPERVAAIDLPTAIRTVTETPAAAAGLTDRGAIRPGLRADLVRVRAKPGQVPVVKGVWLKGKRVA